MGRCNKPMHKACSCCRPAGHDGGHNCLYPDGVPADKTTDPATAEPETEKEGSRHG